MDFFETPQEREKFENNVAKIKHRVAILSGKGGVGKSSVTANLAFFLAMQGKRVGVMDVDFHGPSIPTIMGIQNRKIEVTENGKMLPVRVAENLHAVSLGLLLEDRDNAVIWRGPMKLSAVKQFLSDVEWGELDYLLIDNPPGTGDEPLTVAQFLGQGTEALVVTTPQDVALADVRRSLSFCKQLQFTTVGVVVNMSHFVCPHCGERTDIFPRGGVDSMVADFNTVILGEIPIEKAVSETGDKGKFFLHEYGRTPAGKAFDELGYAFLQATGE